MFFRPCFWCWLWIIDKRSRKFYFSEVVVFAKSYNIIKLFFSSLTSLCFWNIREKTYTTIHLRHSYIIYIWYFLLYPSYYLCNLTWPDYRYSLNFISKAVNFPHSLYQTPSPVEWHHKVVQSFLSFADSLSMQICIVHMHEPTCSFINNSIHSLPLVLHLDPKIVFKTEVYVTW